MDFDCGQAPANTFSRDQHPELRADYIMANPPFNMKAWNAGVQDDDPRWKYGIPPAGNANFAWLQHMLHHLAPQGSMALLLANGSMSSNSNSEGEIRKALIEADLIECMVALPGQLFTNTQIPACIWLLTRNKQGTAHCGGGNPVFRDRRGETLFIDARNFGYMKDRVLRDFAPEDIRRIANTFHAWRKGGNYLDEAGYCKSASLEDIKKHDYVLTPGRYVDAVEQAVDGELFEKKMAQLTRQLGEQFGESAQLEQAIRENLARLGYGG
jgi:type I restriction enzyme M protein